MVLKLMKYDIVAIIWNDAFAFEEEELNKENFQLSPTLQCGLVVDEDHEKIRLVHGFSLDHDEHDFIVIPKASIINKRKVGEYNSKTKKITPTSK
jgi:hypothetical protein